MNLEFLPEAQAELRAVADYYEDKQKGLGKRFSAEIVEACTMILAYPRLWREREGGFRRLNCPVFPYYIAYCIRGESIVVAAIAHQNRIPDYWQGRLP